MVSEQVSRRGGRKPSVLLARICELLDDGAWHDYEPFLREAGKVIPPGLAHRKAETSRLTTAGAPPERRRPASTEQIIQWGRTAFVREMLMTENFERHTVDGRVAQVRMVKLPGNVRYERSRRLAEHLAEGNITDDLLAGQPANILRLLPYEKLLKVAIELAERERERALASRGEFERASEVESETQPALRTQDNGQHTDRALP